MFAFISWLLTHPTTLFALANLKRDLRAIWGWLCHRSFWQLAFGAALILAGWEYIGKRAEQRHATKVEKQLSETIAARKADRRTFASAEIDAAAANLAHNAADKAARERITNDLSQGYETRLASLRADLAKRLLAQPATPQGAPGQSGLPDVSPAPSEPDGGSRVSIPTGLYVRGAELELQLEQLQRWVNEQLKVDPNKP